MDNNTRETILGINQGIIESDNELDWDAVGGHEFETELPEQPRLVRPEPVRPWTSRTSESASTERGIF